MNKFVELRDSCVYEEGNPYIFSLLFIDNYMEQNKTINLSENTLFKKMQNIKKEDLFSLLGENQYLDRYLVDYILKNCTKNREKTIEKSIKEIITNKSYNSEKLYHILDICIECQIDILENRDLAFMLEEYGLDLDILSILIDYISKFKRRGFKEKIYMLLKGQYPDNIKIQILTLIIDLYGFEEIVDNCLEANIRNEKNKVFYDTYIDFLESELNFKSHGVKILQSMFYGDFEDSGKGNNGGLAVLLKGLGDEIAKDSRVSFVFTITITRQLNKAFISYYEDKHVFIRLPIYMDRKLPDPFIKRELSIKRYIGKFLKSAGIEPDLFHIRYLDNASKAVAKLSKEWNKELVFTLTPDPHRNMSDESGKLVQFSLEEILEKLNKIKIGDELIYISDGIVGIGDKGVLKELELYFPQFKEEKIKKKTRMIGEGIQIDRELDEGEGKMTINKFIQVNKINKNFFARPIILNVGRLSSQKGQKELLKAWSNSKLLKSHNLLIIGGDIENPNKEEAETIDFFKRYLEEKPYLKDKFFHKSAISNRCIRLLEKSIISKQLEHPHIYLCSSIKEEFGIAILEAMSQGFLAIGPIKGGVKSYIKNRRNGFVIDTSNWQTIAKETEKYIYDSKIDRSEFKKIQEAGQKTVEELFSMEKISNDFLSFYLSLKGVENNEI